MTKKLKILLLFENLSSHYFYTDMVHIECKGLSQKNLFITCF